jgi:hypothetical protein
MKAANWPTLLALIEPQLTDHNADATSFAHLTTAQQKLYQRLYERWERNDYEFNSEKGKTRITMSRMTTVTTTLRTELGRTTKALRLDHLRTLKVSMADLDKSQIRLQLLINAQC